jgi:hypothetical protein
MDDKISAVLDTITHAFWKVQRAFAGSRHPLINP